MELSIGHLLAGHNVGMILRQLENLPSAVGSKCSELFVDGFLPESSPDLIFDCLIICLWTLDLLICKGRFS